MSPRVFPIAPMDTTMTALTAIVLALVPLFVALAVANPLMAPIHLLTAIGLTALYAGVWIWFRPSAFEVTDSALIYRYPGRSRSIPRAAIRGCRVYSTAAFKQEYGWGLRIGVGGLWGGFGLLVTPKGTLDMAITCTDDLVVVRCEGRRSLLVTPADVEGFVAAVDSRA